MFKELFKNIGRGKDTSINNVAVVLEKCRSIYYLEGNERSYDNCIAVICHMGEIN